MLTTPGGPRLSANIHRVPEGGSVVHAGNKIYLLDASGAVISTAISNAIVNANIHIPTKRFNSGWLAHAHWRNQGSSPISSLTGSWVVPPAPKTNNGQTVYLFNGIEPDSGDSILQPVLQYGPSPAGTPSGSGWGVASWYVTDTQAYYTNLVSVSVGQSLTGNIQLAQNPALSILQALGLTSGYYYQASFPNIGGTTLSVSSNEELTWACQTLEVYGATDASQLPSGNTVFSNIQLQTQQGVPSVTWDTISDPSDGVSATVNTQGAANGQVTITY
ncbi:hypothetical protein DL93DRAFT_2165243 [Clavulina sp. PMI_390]|nr:hypothetical protein DL93DRAFT_2165243 [Clavulina sp. PMI_390]